MNNKTNQLQCTLHQYNTLNIKEEAIQSQHRLKLYEKKQSHIGSTFMRTIPDEIKRERLQNISNKAQGGALCNKEQ